MKKQVLILLFSTICLVAFPVTNRKKTVHFPAVPQTLFPEEKGILEPDAVFNPADRYVWNNPEQPKKRPFFSAAEVIGLNVVVWGFNRYIMNEEFARISLNSVRRNIKHGFVWDNDQFSTNLFAHPYHGNLYFNLARSNGMTFWESIPYAIGGSLMWEIAMENEPPAINDFMATPIAGLALGEVTHRLSNLLLDDSKRGMARFWRELASTAVNPMRGLNRILSGDAWKVRPRYYKYHDYEETPVQFSVEVSDNYLADNNYLFRGTNSLYAGLNVKYGDPLDGNSKHPYDFFTFKIGFNLLGNQPVVNDASLVARLIGRYVEPLPGHELMWGVFQHFDYYDSYGVIHESDLPPFKVAETVAFGLGMIYDLPCPSDRCTIRQSTFANAIVLGGCISDHYQVIDRNYNMGSGYSLKGTTEISFRNYADFSLNIQHYQIYTWKGKRPDQEMGDPLYYNSQGDKGQTGFTIISPTLGVYLTPKLKFQAALSYYIRNTYYKYFENVNFDTFETRLGVVYAF